MNGRNGIMMPLGALVTAFLTVLIVGTITNVVQGSFSQSRTVVSPTSTPPPVPTTTPAPVVTTSAQAEDPNVNGSVTAGGVQDEGQGPPPNPARVQDVDPHAVLSYPLHLVGKDNDLEKLLGGGLTVTWTAAGITSPPMPVDDPDNLVLSTPGPVTKICLAATPPAGAGHWVYSAGTTKFQPTADGACFNGKFPPDGLTITVTKE